MVNFMFPVPEASLPASEICSERSAAGKMGAAFWTLKSGTKTTRSRSRTRGSSLMVSATEWISLMISFAMR
jgi:hypothetical protein